MDCLRPIKLIQPYVVVRKQALHGNTKVRGPGVEAMKGGAAAPWSTCTHKNSTRGGNPIKSDLIPDPLQREVKLGSRQSKRHYYH